MNIEAGKSSVRVKGYREERLEAGELGRLHILRGVSLESIWGLLERCPVRGLDAGESLLTEGQSNATMYMVLAGRLCVHLETPPGEPLAFIETGQTVGEMSVIDGTPACAHVIAACSTRLLAVNEETFWRLVAASHQFAANLLLLLARRMRDNNSTLLQSERLVRRLEHDSTVDALTGLHNRRWLDENLPRFVQRYQRGREPLSVLMVDVDHFKSFNDTHGHAAGDLVLSTVARVLESRLRPTDISARYGGEEFVVILPGTDLDGARVAAERLRQAAANTRVKASGNETLPAVTISLGVSQLKKDDGLADLLARADSALYRAKRNGRNRIEIAK